jgi:hypothetical protein
VGIIINLTIFSFEILIKSKLNHLGKLGHIIGIIEKPSMSGIS